MPDRRRRRAQHERRRAHQKTSRALLRDEWAQAADDAAAARSRPVAGRPPAPPAKVRKRDRLLRLRKGVGPDGPRTIFDLAALARSGRDAVESSWRRTFKGIYVMGQYGGRNGLQALGRNPPNPGPGDGKRARKSRARARLGPHVCERTEVAVGVDFGMPSQSLAVHEARCGMPLRRRRGVLRCQRHGQQWWDVDRSESGRGSVGP